MRHVGGLNRHLAALEQILANVEIMICEGWSVDDGEELQLQGEKVKRAKNF